MKITLKKNVLFLRNKDFIKYLSVIIVIILLISLLFIDSFGKFIPNIMEYFTGEKAEKLNAADQYIVNLGYFGSFLAGTLGLIFGFVSLIFLIFTFLNQTRKNEISEIENRIFKLIELLIEIKNQNLLTEKSQKFLDENVSASDLDFLKNELKNKHLQFSNFFRMLYQILKYINEHEDIIHNRYCEKHLDKRVKSYTNIIRSYLDTNLLTCLSINCYCLSNENGEYDNYKFLLERYEFFEHLPNVLPMQFASYLYYNLEAFGNSTWFRQFNTIRNELLRISTSNGTKDFCEIFLLFLAKSNGKWKNENIFLDIIYTPSNGIFKLNIIGINNEEIPRRLEFKIEKDNSKQTLQILNDPFNTSCDEFKPSIVKDGNKLSLSYLKPNYSSSIGNLVNIRFLILTENQLELELENSSKTYCIPPF